MSNGAAARAGASIAPSGGPSPTLRAMKYVDIASRFGDVTLRITPVPRPWDGAGARPALDIQLTGEQFDASAVVIEDDDTAQKPVRIDPRQRAREPLKRIGTPDQQAY